MMRALPPESEQEERVPPRLKGWRTVLWHSAYGLPAAALAVLDITKEVDITPILSRFMSLDDVPLVLACIAVGGVVLRYFTNTGMGRDDPDRPS